MSLTKELVVRTLICDDDGTIRRLEHATRRYPSVPAMMTPLPTPRSIARVCIGPRSRPFRNLRWHL